MAVPQFTGRWTDGRHAGVSHVGIRIEHALEIWPAKAEIPEKWSLHRLKSAVPLKASAKDALITSQDHPGQTLFVADPAFAAQLLKAAPHLSPGRERWRYAWPGVILGGAVALSAGWIYLFDINPAKAVAQLIPYGAREGIGKQAVTSFTRGHAACTGAAGRAALDVLARKLSDAADSKQQFKVEVVNWDMVNAFALPGEHVVLMSELIKDAASPDELAGVLAHEMGHGIELHPEAGIVRAIGMSAAMELVFSGSSGTIGNLGAMLLQLRYSRVAEREADEHALRILKRAQISPKPIADFFDKLTKLEGGTAKTEPGSGDTKATDAESTAGGTDVGNMFATHPPSPERAKFFRDAATYAAVPALSDAQWQSLRGICAE